MGTTYAKNQVTQITNLTMSAINSAAQTCQGTISQSIQWVIRAKGNIVIRDVQLSQLASVNTTCMATQVASTDLSASVKELVTQKAEAISAGLSLNPTQTSNIVYLSNNLSTEIINTFVQDCVPQIAQGEVLELTSQEGDVTLEAIRVDQLADIKVNCVQDSSSVTKAQTDLETAIDQHAKSISLSLIIIIIVIIGIVVIILSLSLVKLGNNKVVLFFIFLLIAGIVGLSIYAATEEARKKELEEKSKITTRIWQYTGPATAEKWTYEQAQTACRVQGADGLATWDDLQKALDAGFSSCHPGWVAAADSQGNNVGYFLQAAQEDCGDKRGVYRFKNTDPALETIGANCYKIFSG